MDSRGGRSPQGSSEDESADGSGSIKRKWSDLATSMKTMMDKMETMKNAVAKENAEKSAKICRLMQDNIFLERTIMSLENPTLQGPRRPMSRRNPFDVFPAEVWEMIIKKMSLPSELEILCLAFPQLEPLVKKTNRTVFMFEDVAPLVFNHLSLDDMTKCRLVCSKWNQDVCALVENWITPNQVSDASSNHEVTSKTAVPNSNPPGRLKTPYRFINFRNIQKFLGKMANHPGNPFFGRILCLTVGPQTELKYFWKYALELVEKFGKHVCNLEIKCTRPRTNQINFYNAIQQILLHLPNLKCLRIDCDFHASGPSPRRMAIKITSSPLPQLPHLKSLILAFNRETGMIIAFTSFLSQQIRRLKLLSGTLGNVNLKDENLLGFLNLAHLEVHLKSTQDFSRLLKFFSPNLKELCLHSDRFPGPLVWLTSEQVGSLLEKFPRLEHLDFTNCRIERGFSFDSTVQFPRLKIVEIAVAANEDDLDHNLDFLLWLPSLKHLVIDKMYTRETKSSIDQRDQNSTLKIRNYLQTIQILDSNIWTLIPSLEVLELATIIGDETFTRAMFEKHVG